MVFVLLLACTQADPIPTPPTPPSDDRAEERERMVRRQLASRDITDERVLEAMRTVPRHELVPENAQSLAYTDQPLAIGEGQTISQPYIVALMTQLLRITEMENPRVLEIGTGSGYQAAVLAELGAEVWSIEIVEELGERARRDLRRLGYDRVHVRIGDGYAGWPEHAPFDAVIVTAAPPAIPQPLIDQLKVGGRLVIPVGQHYQTLKVITRTEDSHLEREVAPVRFVPMTGRAQHE